MSAETTSRAGGGRLVAVTMIVALTMSMVAAAEILSRNSATAFKLRAYQISATEAPPTGALLGWDALRNSEWAPSDGEGNSIVLFAVGAPGKAGDADYWRDVAARSAANMAAPESIKFVGLCMHEWCSKPAGKEVLTLLSSVDPIQMHALAIYGGRGRALVFRGAALQKVVTVSGDRDAFAAELASAIKIAKTGGT